MHELSIATSIVETVLGEIEKRQLRSVDAIGLRIGALTDVVSEALEFGFTAITSGTVLEGTRLIIERIPVKCKCRACQTHFEVHEFIFVCPQCGSVQVDTEQGNELDIAYLEIDDT